MLAACAKMDGVSRALPILMMTDEIEKPLSKRLAEPLLERILKPVFGLRMGRTLQPAPFYVIIRAGG